MKGEKESGKERGTDRVYILISYCCKKDLGKYDIIIFTREWLAWLVLEHELFDEKLKVFIKLCYSHV